MQATIKSVDQSEDLINVVVEYTDGKTVTQETYKYNSVNLTDKQQVLDNIQNELNVKSAFTQVVEDLKAEIDRPIGLVAVGETEISELPAEVANG